MSEDLVALLYLFASVCFILALKGLSSPETARRGNMFGIIGMAVAIATTIADPDVVSYGYIILAILIGAPPARSSPRRSR